MVAHTQNRFDGHKLGALKSAHDLLDHLSGYLADVEAAAAKLGEENLEDEMCLAYARAVVLRSEVAGLQQRISQALETGGIG